MGLVKPRPKLKGTLTPSFIRRMKELPHVKQPLNVLLDERWFVSKQEVISGNEAFYKFSKSGTTIQKIYYTEDGVQIRTKTIFTHPESLTIGRFYSFPNYLVLEKLNGIPIYINHDGVVLVSATTNYVDINSLLKNNLLIRINSGSLLEIYTPSGTKMLSTSGYYPNSASPIIHDDDEHILLTYGDGSRYTNTLLKVTMNNMGVVQYVPYGSNASTVRDSYTKGSY